MYQKTMILFKTITLIFLLFNLVACAANKTQRRTSTDNPIMGLPHVYAKLAKNDDGIYRFTEYSLTSKKNFVRLNDLSHTYPSQTQECDKGLLSDKKLLCSSDESIFRKKTVDSGDVVKNTIGNAVVGLFTYGLGLSAYYTTEFDWDSYDKAVGEALNNFDRESFVKDVNTIVETTNKRIEEINSNIEHQRLSLESYFNANSKVTDKSGFYLGEVPRIEVYGYTIAESAVENAYATWTDIEGLEKSISGSIEDAVKGVHLKINCGRITGFDYETVGANQTFAYDVLTAKPVTFNIKSKNVLGLAVSPKIGDEVVAVEADTYGNFTFKNNTKRYVKIKNISFYINDKISTKTDLDIELPPLGQSSGLSIKSFSNYADHLVFKNVTLKDLNKHITYGLAIKYVVLDTNKENSLFAEYEDKLNNLTRL